MVIKDPCKKCIVRACCTLTCDKKIEQINMLYSIKCWLDKTGDRITTFFSWIFDRDWVELTGLSIIAMFIVVEILCLIHIIL